MYSYIELKDSDGGKMKITVYSVETLRTERRFRKYSFALMSITYSICNTRFSHKFFTEYERSNICYEDGGCQFTP